MVPYTYLHRAEPADAPDLHTQLEAILDAVWEAEADWRFNDRLDMALRQV